MAVMTSKEFVQRLIEATETPTVYATGGWGASANFTTNRNKYATRTPFNKEEIMNAPNNAFYFDCVCLIKGILWGWKGDTTKQYGGATYASNGVGDYSIKTINSMCGTYTSDFSNIQAGEWLNIGTEHCGIYIGDGRVVESTPIWRDGVQITNLANIGYTTGHSRRWDGHGKLPWIEYPIPKPKVLEEDGVWGKCTSYYLQKVFGTETDGIISGQSTKNRKYLVNCANTSWKYTSQKPYGSDVIEALQVQLGVTHDGVCGTNTIKALQEYLKEGGYYNQKIDGYMGYYTVLGLQRMINNFFTLISN